MRCTLKDILKECEKGSFICYKSIELCEYCLMQHEKGQHPAKWQGVDPFSFAWSQLRSCKLKKSAQFQCCDTF